MAQIWAKAVPLHLVLLRRAWRCVPFQSAVRRVLGSAVAAKRSAQSSAGQVLKSKNPDAPAVKREAEEDWGQ